MVPDDLVLNNTVQIVYDASISKAEPVDYDAVAVLDDTEFKPLVQSTMIEYDIEFTLNAFFDVSCSVSMWESMMLMSQTYDDGTNRASCEHRPNVKQLAPANHPVNNVTYQMPHTPTIFTALSMGADAMNSKVYGAQTNAFAYPHMSRVQLTVFNWDA